MSGKEEEHRWGEEEDDTEGWSFGMGFLIPSFPLTASQWFKRAHPKPQCLTDPTQPLRASLTWSMGSSR